MFSSIIYHCFLSYQSNLLICGGVHRCLLIGSFSFHMFFLGISHIGMGLIGKRRNGDESSLSFFFSILFFCTNLNFIILFFILIDHMLN